MHHISYAPILTLYLYSPVEMDLTDIVSADKKCFIALFGRIYPADQISVQCKSGTFETNFLFTKFKMAASNFFWQNQKNQYLSF